MIQEERDMTEWEALREECLHCRACTLADTRTNVVFGVGAEDAEVLFIGEAPGANEDAQGEPFVGRAGKLLDDMLAMIGLDRSRIYITNSVKCRPPQNRDPLNTEKDACRGYLRAQDHPAALLRDPRKKPETFEDLKRLQAKIREICDHTPIQFA